VTDLQCRTWNTGDYCCHNSRCCKENQEKEVAEVVAETPTYDYSYEEEDEEVVEQEEATEEVEEEESPPEPGAEAQVSQSTSHGKEVELEGKNIIIEVAENLEEDLVVQLMEEDSLLVVAGGQLGDNDTVEVCGDGEGEMVGASGADSLLQDSEDTDLSYNVSYSDDAVEALNITSGTFARRVYPAVYIPVAIPALISMKQEKRKDEEGMGSGENSEDRRSKVEKSEDNDGVQDNRKGEEDLGSDKNIGKVNSEDNEETESKDNKGSNGVEMSVNVEDKKDLGLTSPHLTMAKFSPRTNACTSLPSHSSLRLLATLSTISSLLHLL